MATREIVELPDKHTGDINEIRDKKIALASEASGATDITAQCEYLIKNGQTGEFMNVLKSYIDESVRSALGALVNNLDKGTTIKSVLATDSSNDLGSITPANLASVLGAVPQDFVYRQTIAAGQTITLKTGQDAIIYFMNLSTGRTQSFGAWIRGYNTIGHFITPTDMVLDPNLSGDDSITITNTGSDGWHFIFRVLYLFN